MTQIYIGKREIGTGSHYISAGNLSAGRHYISSGNPIDYIPAERLIGDSLRIRVVATAADNRVCFLPAVPTGTNIAHMETDIREIEFSDICVYPGPHWVSYLEIKKAQIPFGILPESIRTCLEELLSDKNVRFGMSYSNTEISAISGDPVEPLPGFKQNNWVSLLTGTHEGKQYAQLKFELAFGSQWANAYYIAQGARMFDFAVFDRFGFSAVRIQPGKDIIAGLLKELTAFVQPDFFYDGDSPAKIVQYPIHCKIDIPDARRNLMMIMPERFFEETYPAGERGLLFSGNNIIEQLCFDADYMGYFGHLFDLRDHGRGSFEWPNRE